MTVERVVKTSAFTSYKVGSSNLFGRAIKSRTYRPISGMHPNMTPEPSTIDAIFTTN